MPAEPVLMSNEVAGSYKNEQLILSLKDDGKAELLQLDWAAPLTGLWTITSEQVIEIELPGDRLWQRRRFGFQGENIVDLQDNQAWRRQ